MICERIREQLPECLAGRLDKAARDAVMEHLESCSACRAELAQLGVVWRALEGLALPGPNAAEERAMHGQFAARLEAFQAGLEQGRAVAAAQSRPAQETSAAWWSSLWRRPAWQFAAALGLIAVGFWGGRSLMAPRPGGEPESVEVAQLKGQVESLRQIVAISMLGQQSPSARLQGVTYAYQISQPDAQVEQALLHAVNHDANVNVRLSAVDALQKYGADPQVRRALEDAIALQDSPLVQVALIDTLVQLNDRASAPALQAVARNATAEEAVRMRATWAMQRLGTVPTEEKQ